MKSFSYLDRKAYIKKMQQETFDIFIVGGGINGAGVARDAAYRGMKVGLIEANDFSSGTSSRSSKLVHGGIRYLENFEFGLVFEALSERAKLFDMAPHLVHPLRFVLPIYKDSRVGMFKMGLGMFLYDVLSMFEAPELFEKLNPIQTLARLPLLDAKNLRGSYVYSDGYMDDDRLVIETLRDANEHGALAVNYVKAVGGQWEGDKLVALHCKDELTGEAFTVKAKHFVGSLGPWTDVFGKNILKTWKPILRPTKGIHLTVPRDRVAMNQAVVMFSNDQKRIVFGIPRHEMMIFGTTDTDFKDDPSTVHSTEQDVSYLLNIIQEYFPNAKLQAEDVIGSYAGVRPLVSDGSSSESKTSREHVILRDKQNITLVAGGKYTTYRLMSKQVVDAALKSYSTEDRVKFKSVNTASPLNAKASTSQLELARRSVGYWKRHVNLPLKDLQVLADRHGMEAEEILKNYDSDIKSVWQLEAKHALRNTMCVNLRDFYLRRSPLFLARHDHGLELMPLIHQELEAAYNEFGLSAAKQEELLQEHINLELGWKKVLVET
jgi:glycerol-3-phosphate dehydrogenase